jgi:ComF family protein
MPSLNAVVAEYAFEGVVRSAIIGLKYRGRRRLVPFLASLLTEALTRRPLTVDLLLPVPMGAARLAERGFNQSELLALATGLNHDIPVATGALIRSRETKQQTRLSAIDRDKNVEGAFAIADASMVEGKRVLLLDDVCTTGATLEACAATLLQAGAAGVWALVAARELTHSTGKK